MTALVDVLHTLPLSGGLRDALPPAGRTRAAAQRRSLTSVTPWRARDAGRSLVLAVAGLVGIGFCWYGASYQSTLRNQIGWILGSLLATATFVLAGVLWLLVGFQEVRRGDRELDLDKHSVFGLAGEPAPSEQQSLLQDADQFVTGTGMARAHLRSCLLVKGKQVDVVEGARLPALRPCGVCRPAQIIQGEE